MDSDSTKSKILDVAQHYCQKVGFNAFSYADIAKELNLKKASIHYHYPTKAKLGQALIERYHQQFSSKLDLISQQHPSSPYQQITSLMALMAGLLAESRLCLCGMLASDFATLDPDMQKELQAFFQTVENWLTLNIECGVKSGLFAVLDSPKIVARGFVATLQGMLMTARAFNEPVRYEGVGNWLISTIYNKQNINQSSTL